MKNIFQNFMMLLLSTILLISCVENAPVVPDPPIITSDRKVLVEEFTGVRCPNCPIGSQALKDLIGVYGENLVVVSIHAGDFVATLPESTIDFKTDEGENLINYLGAPSSYPSAVVNRKDFDGGNYFLQSTLTKWSGFIASEIVIEPRITVEIEKTYDPVTRELNLEIFGVVKDEDGLDGDLRMTIMITESNIVNAQDDDTQGGVVVDYVHDHVFRTTLTNFDGDSFASNLSAGDNYTVTKNGFVIPDDWKPEDCEIVAFVNLVDGQNKEVLQADQTHLTN